MRSAGTHTDRRRRVRVVSGRSLSGRAAVDAALVLAAVAAVVVAVVIHARPHRTPTPAQRAQQTRTNLSTIAARELVIMNRIDYRRVDADLAARAAVVTGALATSVGAQRVSLASTVRSQRTVVSSRALWTAVDTVDVTAGTARVISLLQVSIGRAPRQSIHEERVIAHLVREPKGWLLGDLTVVP